jgi:hypothetical protein
VEPSITGTTPSSVARPRAHLGPRGRSPQPQRRAAPRLRRGLRTQRKDGTVSLDGRRFEVPSRYRHLPRLHLRDARWDLRHVDLVDPHTQALLATLYPLDKTTNALGHRRRLQPPAPPELSPAAPAAPGGAVAPLLRKLMADYAATGLPPAYLPQPEPAPEEPQP